MRFGFGYVPRDIASSVRLSRLGESLGYDSAWIPDQTFFDDPFVLIAACARETERIRFNLGVTNPYTRHPVQVARAIATLDELTGGRVDVGYGAGNRDELLRKLGLSEKRAAQRCREATLITRRLLEGEELSYRSDTVVVDRVRLLGWRGSSAVVTIAARGRLLLEAAGAVAGGAIFGGLFSRRGIAYGLGAVRAGAAKAGRSLDGFQYYVWGNCVLTDGEHGFDVVRPLMAIAIARAPIDVLRTVGVPEARIAALKAIYAAEGREAVAREVTPEDVAPLALIGSTDHVVARLRELETEGVHEVGLLLQQPTEEGKASFLRDFAARVISRMR